MRIPPIPSMRIMHSLVRSTSAECWSELRVSLGDGVEGASKGRRTRTGVDKGAGRRNVIKAISPCLDRSH